jgi:hypothetical protein
MTFEIQSFCGNTPYAVDYKTKLHIQSVSKFEEHNLIYFVITEGLEFMTTNFLDGAVQDHSVASRMIYMRIFIYIYIYISRICSGRMATEINTNSRHQQRYSYRNIFQCNILLPAGSMQRFNEYLVDGRQPKLIRIST